MDKRKILISMIILTMVIILILLALIYLNGENGNYNNSNNLIYNNLPNNNSIIDNPIINNYYPNNTIPEIPSNEVEHDDSFTLEVTKDYFDVKIDSVYFAIKNKAEDFFETITEVDNNTEKLYNILAKEYINKNGIKKQNLKTIFSKYTNSNYNIEKIKEKIVENNICIFIVYGTTNGNETYNMAIVTDENNLNYCIYPYEYLKSNGINSFNVSSIVANDYNKIVYNDITKEKVAQYHFENYKYYAQNDPEKLYNKLDSEYSKKRFGSLENFKEYIKENKYRIQTSTIQSYKFTRNGDYAEYSCIDNYSNRYIFKELASMQYTVMLDNYTIMPQEDIEYYNDLDVSDKAKYNVSKFINMVNNNDFNGIYNVLNNTFKNNNFKDVNTLKQYIQKNMYTLNTVEYEDIDRESSYITFKCKLINIQNNDETKFITININLTEGTDFTLSFNLE